MTQPPWISDEWRRVFDEMGRITAFQEQIRNIRPALDIVPKIDLDPGITATLKVNVPNWSLPEAFRIQTPLAGNLGVTPPITALSPQLIDLTKSIHSILPPLELPYFRLYALDLPKLDLRIPGIDQILETLAKRFPFNWPDDRPDLDEARRIVEDEGIPLVYIPRAEIVAELVGAADRGGRVALLVTHTAEILDDCAGALDRSLHAEVDAQRPLLQAAVATLRSGHTEGAQALSISVCDTLIGAHIDNSHQKAKNQCAVGDIDDAFAIDWIRIRLGLAPVVNLLTDWHPKSGKPRPVALSRHVTVHQAHPDHYTPGNAITSVMVATGLMLALDEMYTKGSARNA